ncbi:MAG: inositol monophosphatase family protein [Spirochaetales bacterium]|nr:inositol monophosphatase family protein [Spirochaetales bacterium]
MKSQLQEYLYFASRLSQEAGRITLKYFRKPLNIEVKKDSSPVTVADRETESFVRQAILEKYPDHGILGEEFGAVESNSPYTWVIDPIDGTKSFIHGIPLYTVLIALLEEGKPMLGVIHNPPLGETAAAAEGMGCTLNGSPCRVGSTASLGQARVQVTDPADLLRRHPVFTSRLFERAGLCRSWGDGYGYLLVATGRADVMLDPVLNPWDVAPLKVVITEAGGKMTDFAGRSTALGESAIAANVKLHGEVVGLLE